MTAPNRKVNDDRPVFAATAHFQRRFEQLKRMARRRRDVVEHQQPTEAASMAITNLYRSRFDLAGATTTTFKRAGYVELRRVMLSSIRRRRASKRDAKIVEVDPDKAPLAESSRSEQEELEELTAALKGRLSCRLQEEVLEELLLREDDVEAICSKLAISRATFYRHRSVIEVVAHKVLAGDGPPA